jgi:OmpA-OmpF porin, OOP family
MQFNLTRRKAMGLAGLAAVPLLLPSILAAQTDEEATRILRALAPNAPSASGAQPRRRPVDADDGNGGKRKISVDNARTVDLQIFFAFDSDRIDERSYPVLASLGRVMTSSDLAGSSFLVAGHTDATGRQSYNAVLSRRRAKAVRQYLIDSFPIEAGRLFIAGYGSRRLADPDNPKAGVNRRVEIAIVLP